jgi:hypothetical protein
MSNGSGPTDAGFENDEMAIREFFLVERLKDFSGYGYDMTKGVCYPWPLPRIKVTTGLQEPKTNCCTFIEALLVKAWDDAAPDLLKWGPERHGQMMIWGDDLFSPITAVVEAGMAVPIDTPETEVPPWTLVQGWKDLPGKKGGHTFLVVAQRGEAVLTLEANSHYQLDGVGFRGLGHAEAFDFEPPSNWWRDEALWQDAKMWTWPRIRAAYPDLRMARLKVTELEWVK